MFHWDSSEQMPGSGKEARFINTIESWMVCYFVSTGVGLQGFSHPLHPHPHSHPTFRLECLLFVCREMEGVVKRKPSKFWRTGVCLCTSGHGGREEGQGEVVASFPVLTPYRLSTDQTSRPQGMS